MEQKVGGRRERAWGEQKRITIVITARVNMHWRTVVKFEVDTGCGLTILNMKTFQEKSEKCPSIEENSPEVENIYKAKDKGAGENVCESELQTARKDIAHHSS